MPKITKQWLIGLALCLVSELVMAGDWATSVNGEITFAVRQNEDRKTPLVSDPDLLEIEKRYSEITPVVNFEAFSDNVTITGQARSELQRGGDFEDETGTLDELYAEFAATPNLFLFAGRRNIAFGQAAASYSMDFFLEPLEINRSKNFDRRRREVVGEDMVGFELLLTPDYSVAGYHLPRQDKHQTGEHPARSLATLSWVLPWEADVKLLALDSARSGLGFSYVQSIGDALLLYAEGVVRDGRDRGRITPQNMRVEAATPDNGEFEQFTLGGNYTFESSLGMTVEYYHDGNGFSDTEWRDISKILASSTNPFSLLGLNCDLRLHTLRRNYGFLQLSHPELFGVELMSEISTFHNLDDDSGAISARLEKGLGKSTIGLHISSAYGNDGEEFKLRSPNLSIIGYYSVRF